MSTQRGIRGWLAAASRPNYQELESDAFWGQLSDLWNRLPPDVRRNVEVTFFPENPMERPIPGEEVQLEIRPAWYRDILGHLFFHNTWQLLAIAVILTIVIAILAFVFQFFPYISALPAILFLFLGLYSFRERVEFMQYRLVKTNARLIISLPQRGGWPFVDNIELKGLPTVLDTNWSKNPIWRLFQMLTGARDLYISMAGYQFVEGSAKVRDALSIPDVMPNDAVYLKRLVFAVPSAGGPQKVSVVELSPEVRQTLTSATQKVSITEISPEARQQISESVQASTPTLRPLILRRNRHRRFPSD